MQIDLTTFILELINFVILVWLLKRFLYKPIQEVMAKRRLKVAETMQDAATQKMEAENLRAQYETLSLDWKKEQETAHATLMAELATTRKKGLEDVSKAVDAENQRLEVAGAKKRKEMQKQLETRALILGAAFASKFLGRLTSQSLDTKLAKILIEDIENWPREKIETGIAALQENDGKIIVTSAHELTMPTQKSLEKLWSTQFKRPCHMEFSIDDTLLAGLRITVGSWVIQANTKDELAFFAGKLGYEN